MRVDYSKEFIKAVKKISGKQLESVKDTIKEVKKAKTVFDITDCKRLTNFKNIYRIRIGGYRAFFTYHIQVVDDTVFFQYLIARGQAYSKEVQTNLKKKD